MSADEDVAVSPGDILAGKYQVEQILGVGGMGFVAAARHLDLGEIFAIKLMHPECLEDAKATERFLREARACARLRGEHVAKVHDVGRLEDGAPYMVMEYLEGVDLRQIVKTQGALPVDTVVDYVIQACEAISEAHALGIIHRDIKPGNIFLTHRPNGTACIKVLDFGISKQLGTDAGLDVTKTQDMLGSPLYMSPEQMRSGKAADPRTDVWSLGVVLYELASGGVPFAGNSVTEVCARVIQDPPMRLVGHVPEVSPAFEAIILRCLAKDPEDRYQTADELAGALLSLRQEGFVSAGSPVGGPGSAGSPVGAPLSAPVASELRGAVELSTSASWGGTASRTRPTISRLHIGLGVGIGVLLGALCVTIIFLARHTSEPTLAAASSVAPAVTATIVPPVVSATAPAEDAGAAEVASSAAEASADRPKPAPFVKGKPNPKASAAPGGKRPPVVDYGDRQ